MGTSNWALARQQQSHSQEEEDEDIHLAFWGPLPTSTTTPNTPNTNNTHTTTNTTTTTTITNANTNTAHHLLLPLKTEDCLSETNQDSCISSSLLLQDLSNGSLRAALHDMRNSSSKRPRQVELDQHHPAMSMILSSSNNSNNNNNNMTLLSAEYDHNPSNNLSSRTNGDDDFSGQQLPQNSDTHQVGLQTLTKKKRNLPGTPDPDAEVIALSPRTLLATNRFLCEICGKGFQRDQNLQLHRRGHNLPWKLRQRNMNEVARKKVYVCPESSCVHHEAARALGDLTGIKKHFLRKHGDKKWKCDKCNKRYAVQCDWKAHLRTCGTKEYLCDCGTKFARKDSFVTHRAFCEAIAHESAMASQHVTIPSRTETTTGIPSSSSSPSNHIHHHHHHNSNHHHHHQQQMLMVMPPPHVEMTFDQTQNSVSSVMVVDQLMASNSSQNHQQQQEHPMFSLWHKSSTPPGFFPTNSNDPMLLGLPSTEGVTDIATSATLYSPSSDKSGYINVGNSHGLIQKASTQMGSNLNGSHFWPDWGLQGRATSNFLINDDLSHKMGNYSSSINRMWPNESSSSSSSSAIAAMQGGFGGSSILHFPVDLGVQDLMKSLSESSNSTRSTLRPNNLQSSFDVYEFLQNPCEAASSSIQEAANHPNSMLETGGQFRSSINNPIGHHSTLPPPPPYRPTLDFLGLGGVSHQHPPPIGHPVRPILAHMQSDIAFNHHHMHANSDNISSAEPSP